MVAMIEFPRSNMCVVVLVVVALVVAKHCHCQVPMKGKAVVQ